MRDRIIITKMNSLLTLFLGIFFAFSLTSCERSVPTSSDVTLVGTAWQGTVATKDTKGQIVEVSVKISFHGNSVGHWHFEERGMKEKWHLCLSLIGLVHSHTSGSPKRF